MRKKRFVKRKPVTQPLGTSYRYIPLTRNKVAIVDAADFKWLSRRNWYASYHKLRKTFTAIGHVDCKKVKMHRYILNCKDGEQVDHKNMNSLDNRRKNIRKCTHMQNECNSPKPHNNTSGYKGSHFVKREQKWVGYINFKNKHHFLGYFSNREAAARAYDKAAKKLHGKFARLNFPR